MNQIIQGDCQVVLKTLPADSVDLCVTSPPYWGLRKYKLSDTIWDSVDGCRHEQWGNAVISRANDSNRSNMDWRTGGNPAAKVLGQKVSQGQFCLICGAWKGQLGLESNPELYIKHLVQIFQEVRRVLKPTGTCFVNLGDSYWGGKGKSGYELPHEAELRRSNSETIQTGHNVPGYLDMRPSDGKHPVLKPKDLCLIPFRFVIAMQEVGWWVRSTIIWNKPNPMPESVKDRPTESHEYIFMFTKSAHYYWNQEAVREEYNEPLNSWGGNNVRNSSHKYIDGYEQDGDNGGIGAIGKTSMLRAGALTRSNPSGRNLRSVWTFPTVGFPGAHFATFPPRLPETCIKAGCPEQVCEKCGKPWVDVVERYLPEFPKSVRAEPTCSCNADTLPGTVLDPFAGSGTVGEVAIKLGRRYILIEQSDEYINLIQDRVKQMGLL